MQDIVIVNASPILWDEQVEATVSAMQTQIDRDFMPRWRGKVEPVRLSFLPWKMFDRMPNSAWPIFVNRHSKDDSMLGYHTDENGLIYSRVYAGDAMRVGLDWTVTLSHELLEIIVNPGADRVFRMANGQYAAVETCDAVEADDQAYLIDGIAVSNFVFPSYFSRRQTGPKDIKYDFRGMLKGPCPALTPGGYMALMEPSGEWTNIYADKADGLLSRRAILNGFRRKMRTMRPATIEFDPDVAE